MPKNYYFLIFILLSFAAKGQCGDKCGKIIDTDRLSQFHSDYSQAKIYNHSIDEVKEHLNKIFLFSDQGLELNLESSIKSPYSEHYTFSILKDDVAVYRCMSKVNLDLNGNVLSCFTNLPKLDLWEETVIPPLENHGAFVSYIEKNYSEVTITERNKAWFPVKSGEFVNAIIVQVLDRNTWKHEEVVLGEKKILFKHDLNSYNESGKVFNPNPIVSANTSYGETGIGGFRYVDSMDVNFPLLAAERVNGNFSATLDAGFYSLKNEFVEMRNIDGPNFEPPKSATGIFEYNRDDNEFEAVNTFYHLNTINTYIQELGFTNMASFKVIADANALNGDDNSFFNFTGGQARLFFGEGGVDDAEDAQVVVHEYAHALSNQAAPSSNFGSERQALDESFGDYLAVTYSRDINDHSWNKVFSWDGHNEYWSGRIANTPLVYKSENVTPNIHITGQLFTAVMFDIWEKLGKETTDRIMLQSMYQYAPDMSMKDAARILLSSDSLIFSGSNYCEIYTCLQARNFIDSIGTGDCTFENNEFSFQIRNGLDASVGKSPITIVSNTELNNAKIELFDYTGKKLLILNGINGFIVNLNVKNLAISTGTYIIRVSNEGDRYSDRFVKLF